MYLFSLVIVIVIVIYYYIIITLLRTLDTQFGSTSVCIGTGALDSLYINIKDIYMALDLILY
jgi:hypothetical protein